MFLSFGELTKSCGPDLYSIETKHAGKKYGIFAIHGGKIDLLTGVLAKEIAGQDHSLYVFDAKSSDLRIPSTSFDEENVQTLASQVETVISIHGERDEDNEHVMLGGLDTDMIDKLESVLTQNGYEVVPPRKGLEGTEKSNICNQGTSGRGVQIEISRKLRKRMYEDPEARSLFVNTIRKALG